MQTNTAIPSIAIDLELFEKAKQETEKMTILHGTCKMSIREWIPVWSDLQIHIQIGPETKLMEDTGREARLIQVFNMRVTPEWTLITNIVEDYHYTLIFEGLSKTCKSFRLLEQITEPGGFYSELMERNETDVYEFKINI